VLKPPTHSPGQHHYRHACVQQALAACSISTGLRFGHCQDPPGIGGFRFGWTVTDPSTSVGSRRLFSSQTGSVVLSAALSAVTRGWAAWGLPGARTGGMVGATAIVVWMDSFGTVHTESYYICGYDFARCGDQRLDDCRQVPFKDGWMVLRWGWPSSPSFSGYS
jgi:hypothetical protein